MCRKNIVCREYDIHTDTDIYTNKYKYTHIQTHTNTHTQHTNIQTEVMLFFVQKNMVWVEYGCRPKRIGSGVDITSVMFSKILDLISN